MKTLLVVLFNVTRSYIRVTREGMNPVAFWHIWIGPEMGFKLKLASELSGIDPDKLLKLSVASGVESALAASIEKLGQKDETEAPPPCD